MGMVKMTRMVFDGDAARERRERTGHEPGRTPRDRRVRLSCERCRGSLGPYTITRTDRGPVVIGARGADGDGTFMPPRRSRSRVVMESFEDRGYARVVCEGCGRNAKVQLEVFQARLASDGNPILV